MNPVLPIAAGRTARAASVAVACLAGYRLLTNKNPAPTIVLCVNAAITAALCLDLVAAFYGPCNIGYPGLYTRMENAEGKAALTFDDGPDPRTTLRLLDILDRYDAKATFFFLGEKCALHPELVKQTLGRGHSVAMHGYTHIPLAFKSRSFVRSQIIRNAAQLNGEVLPYFRPPYGFKSAVVRDVCKAQGVLLTTWSINPKDYLEPEPDEISRRIISKLHGGAIILLHEWVEATHIALPGILEQMRSCGYEPSTLPAVPRGTFRPQELFKS